MKEEGADYSQIPGSGDRSPGHGMEDEDHARSRRARGGGKTGPRRPRLTWEGVVTLISGTNVSSNRLRICSCLSSLDGVCLGGGGTGGPFRSCGSAGEGAAQEAEQSVGVRGRQRQSHG